jgi:hypothetical protein
MTTNMPNSWAPHAIYLHSAPTKSRTTCRHDSQRRRVLRFAQLDVLTALGLAVHRYPAEPVGYLNGRGSRKVLFGSNYPMITPASLTVRLGPTIDAIPARTVRPHKDKARAS